MSARKAAEAANLRGSDREKGKWCGCDGESRPSVASCVCPEFGFDPGVLNPFLESSESIGQTALLR
jgi:hypothetical protein